MEYDSWSNVLCLGDLKLSALFFDRVVPVSDLFIDLGHYENAKEALKFRILKNLVGIQTTSNASMATFTNRISALFELSRKFTEKLIEIEERDLLGKFRKVRKEEMIELQNYMPLIDTMRNWSQIIDRRKKKKIYFDDFNIFLGLSIIEKISIPNIGSISQITESVCHSVNIRKPSLMLPGECLTFYNKVDDDVTLSLAGIPTIDTCKLSWENIMEFRNNKEAKNKLRNLRLFLCTNYEGKSRAFIEDDLSRRIDDYKETCRDFGFETKTSILSAVLDSKNIRATFVASAGAAIFNEPVVVAGTILAGVSIEIGKIVIEISKRKHAFHKIKRDHPLAYLIEINEICS